MVVPVLTVTLNVGILPIWTSVWDVMVYYMTMKDMMMIIVRSVTTVNPVVDTLMSEGVAPVIRMITRASVI